MDSVCVIGLGYIGLPTASLLATKGFQVIGIDINGTAVDKINRGEIHIHEPDLDILVKSAVHSGNLKAALEPSPADVFVIAVPTPLGEANAPDMSHVTAATLAIAPHLRPGNLVILESTSPVGSTENIAAILAKERPDLIIPRGSSPDSSAERIFLAHCPERVLPGQILKELVDNDRIVGGIDDESSERARSFYEGFCNGEIFVTDSRTAEMAKLTENAYRDVNIAFANELSLVCESLGISVWELIELANRHPRVNILAPGPGVGGHCIAVDPWFIVHSAPQDAILLRTARGVNDSKPGRVVQQIREKTSHFPAPVIACLGLAYKANVDDLRESPAVRIVSDLSADDALRILVVEPFIAELPAGLRRENVELVGLDQGLQRADIVVVLVNHQLFEKVDSRLLQEKIVIDTRGVWR